MKNGQPSGNLLKVIDLLVPAYLVVLRYHTQGYGKNLIQGFVTIIYIKLLHHYCFISAFLDIHLPPLTYLLKTGISRQ